MAKYHRLNRRVRELSGTHAPNDAWHEPRTLGEALSLPFQHCAEIYRATNLIGASRLRHISQNPAGVHAFLFEGATPAATTTRGHRRGTFTVHRTDFLASSDGLALHADQRA